MAITENARATVLALTTTALIGAAGCGDSPTAVRGPGAAIQDAQAECDIIDGQLYCKTSVHITQDSTRKP